MEGAGAAGAPDGAAPAGARLAWAARVLRVEWVRAFVLRRADAAADVALLAAPGAAAAAVAFTSVSRSRAGPSADLELAAETVCFPCVALHGYTLGVAVQRDQRCVPHGTFAARLESLLAAATRGRLEAFTVGRFCYCDETGEMFILLFNLGEAGDLQTAAISQVIKSVRGVTGSDIEDAILSPTASVLWWRPRGSNGSAPRPGIEFVHEKFTALVDYVLFEKERYAEAIIRSSYCAEQSRGACFTCLSRKNALSQPLSSVAWKHRGCQCSLTGNALLSTDGPAFSLRHMRRSRGLWRGNALLMMRSPCRGSLPMLAHAELTVGLEMTSDASLIRRFQDVVISHRVACMLPSRPPTSQEVAFPDDVVPSQCQQLCRHQSAGPSAAGRVSLKRRARSSRSVAPDDFAGDFNNQTIPAIHFVVSEPCESRVKDNPRFPVDEGQRASERSPFSSEDHRMDSERESEETRHDHPLAAAVASPGRPDDHFPVIVVPSAASRRSLSEERQKRNRAAASRSNLRRKKENAEICETLKMLHQRVTQLRTREFELVRLNIELRRRVAEQGAAARRL